MVSIFLVMTDLITNNSNAKARTPSATPASLTEQQIKNWRNQLAMTIGPYAFIMPDDEVQRHRDRMMKRLSKLSK